MLMWRTWGGLFVALPSEAQQSRWQTILQVRCSQEQVQSSVVKCMCRQFKSSQMQVQSSASAIKCKCKQVQVQSNVSKVQVKSKHNQVQVQSSSSTVKWKSDTSAGNGSAVNCKCSQGQVQSSQVQSCASAVKYNSGANQAICIQSQVQSSRVQVQIKWYVVLTMLEARVRCGVVWCEYSILD